ncbi:MAG: RES domain-containing protein [Hyphomicrobiales bacterium]|nr:MAG: RES domain-containing protein [Hyphomicrobiales bacterium]
MRAVLSSEFLEHEGLCWRFVEAQNRISTLKLVDSLEEQEILELVCEESKPVVPETCRDLDYLLATPFRYWPAPKGSRFRRERQTDGVFYCAEHQDTAAAEISFYRLLFYSESPGLKPPGNGEEFTCFSVKLASLRCIDLTKEPFLRDRAKWTAPHNYSACHDLADRAREAAAELIRYESVRDPMARANIAVLQPSAFSSRAPISRETWHIHVKATTVLTVCEFPRRALEFDIAHFSADARLASLQLER